MKKISQLGIVFTGLLLTIPIIQEPASAIPSPVVRDGAEWLRDQGSEKVNDIFNTPRNRRTVDDIFNDPLEDPKQRRKVKNQAEKQVEACIEELSSEQEKATRRQKDRNFTDFHPTNLTRRGCGEVRELFD